MEKEEERVLIQKDKARNGEKQTELRGRETDRKEGREKDKV